MPAMSVSNRVVVMPRQRGAERKWPSMITGRSFLGFLRCFRRELGLDPTEPGRLVPTI
jgi:hypothetical protein